MHEVPGSELGGVDAADEPRLAVTAWGNVFGNTFLVDCRKHLESRKLRNGVERRGVQPLERRAFHVTGANEGIGRSGRCRNAPEAGRSTCGCFLPIRSEAVAVAEDVAAGGRPSRCNGAVGATGGDAEESKALAVERRLDGSAFYGEIDFGTFRVEAEVFALPEPKPLVSCPAHRLEPTRPGAVLDGQADARRQARAFEQRPCGFGNDPRAFEPGPRRLGPHSGREEARVRCGPGRCDIGRAASDIASRRLPGRRGWARADRTRHRGTSARSRGGAGSNHKPFSGDQALGDAAAQSDGVERGALGE